MASQTPPTVSTERDSSILIATWNVNSLRMRWDRLSAWLTDKRPDVLCLQEIKMQDADFPSLELHSAGYHAICHGQKTYNGVAILSRIEHGAPERVERGMQDGDPDAESRLIVATIPGLGLRVGSVYVPNGQAVGADKYDYKLRWLRRFRSYLDRSCNPSESLAMCGDYNIAPGDDDVHDPEVWRDTVICHPDARAGLQSLLDFGLQDTLRKVHPEGRIYSYWDYRGLSFPKNLGIRIDHILATKTLAERCHKAEVDRQARKGEKPSDHAPVQAWFERAP
jgi:exodeoxyribonuclease-3